MKKLYPVGATWEARNDKYFYQVHLKLLVGKTEMWYCLVEKVHPDGSRSVMENDWYPTRYGAMKEARAWIDDTKNTRFKRVK